MIDLFSLWLGGFLMAMVLNCVVVKELRKEIPNSPAALIVVAMLWPLMMGFALWVLIRDN